MPDAFIRIAPDDSVTVLIKHLDMGQGVITGLTTIVAEELDADWSQMRAEFAPANAKLYNGRYRPMFYHSVRAGLDASGKLLAWRHRLAGQSFILGTPLESNLVKSGVDVTAVEGIVDMPYAIPNLQVDWRNAASPVTTLWWRSVKNSRSPPRGQRPPLCRTPRPAHSPGVQRRRRRPLCPTASGFFILGVPRHAFDCAPSRRCPARLASGGPRRLSGRDAN